MQTEIKTIGASGHLSLGKKYAGRTVTVEQVEAGVWVIKSAQVIPDNERWLHTPEMKESLDRSLAWSDTHPPQATGLRALEARIRRRR
jgi:hypothetical protein